jgi:transmembrane sensor
MARRSNWRHGARSPTLLQFDKDKRVVILSGEATFDIAKDPARPFLVVANEVTTKVLGTQF